jgi:hypothetical protein
MHATAQERVTGPSLLTSPPSRYDNPFATCWTRPGAIEFHFPKGQSAAGLIAQLAAQQWRGAIVGPHGSGKSTLLESLKPALRAAGFHVHAITLQNGQRRLPSVFGAGLRERGAIAVIDGFEQLGWPHRLKLHYVCRRARVGLIVTSHSPTHIPTLIRLAPDANLVQRLVVGLSARVSTLITSAHVVASHAFHGGNVREVFFDLYDRHEKLRRAKCRLIGGGERVLDGEVR